MNDIKEKIFTGKDKEYYGFRKRLAFHLNEFNRSFSNNTGGLYRGSSWEINLIHKFSFESISGDDFYYIECTVNSNGKNKIEKYSIDPKILVNFFRLEKLNRIKEKINDN